MPLSSIPAILKRLTRRQLSFRCGKCSGRMDFHAEFVRL
jgi:hypothetical protein